MYIKSPLKRALMTKKVQAASNQYWNKLESYNYQQVFPHRYQAQVDFTKRHLVPRMKKTDMVVDIGCGDGWHSFELECFCQQLQGYDFSANLINLAIQAAAARGLAERFTFDVANVLSLHLPEKSADVVLLCGIMTCLVSNRDAVHALRLAASTVKSGGYVLYKDTLHRGKGTRLNYGDGYGAVYRDRDEYLSLIARNGMHVLADEWIDVTDEYGSLMVIAERRSS